MGPEMTQTEPGEDVIRNAVMLACRAPSLHNTQPWRWTFDGAGLHLFADRTRVVMSTDSTGREVLLSCGAALDHLRVAMAAAGWDTTVERFPDPHDPDHVAALRFTPTSTVTDSQCERADAILARRTDRLPFDTPPEWPSMEARLRLAVIPYHVMTDIVLDRDRPILAEASRHTEQLRSCDPSYQSELDWWTSSFVSADGVPQTSLVSDSEAGRVDVARTFPPARPTERRPDISVDRSKIIVLSTSHEDARCDVLRCGEALSAVLLECTLAGLATCTLTHMTEVAPSRDIIRQLIGQTGSPQLLIRIGIAPSDQQQAPATPRRPLTEVLELSHSVAATRDLYESQFKLHVVPDLGDVAVKALTPSGCEAGRRSETPPTPPATVRCMRCSSRSWRPRSATGSRPSIRARSKWRPTSTAKREPAGHPHRRGTGEPGVVGQAARQVPGAGAVGRVVRVAVGRGHRTTPPRCRRGRCAHDCTGRQPPWRVPDRHHQDRQGAAGRGAPHIREDVARHLDNHVGQADDALMFTPVRGGCHLNDKVFADAPPARADRHTGRRHRPHAQALRRHHDGSGGRHADRDDAAIGHTTAKASMVYQAAVDERDVEIAKTLSRLAEGG